MNTSKEDFNVDIWDPPFPSLCIGKHCTALHCTALHCTYIKITRTLENLNYTKTQKNKPTNIFSDFIGVLRMRGATGGQIYLN